MIELFWKVVGIEEHEAFIMLSRFFVWVSESILKYCKLTNKDMSVDGYLIIRNPFPDYSILIMCNGGTETQKEFLEKVLKQPPGEYKGKYIARIVNDDDGNVREEKTEGDDAQIKKPESEKT